MCFGANLQPGQILTISSEPGQEKLARAIAESAYRHGARYVDLSVFDLHLKRARALYAEPDTLDYVPPWLGARVLQLGELRCARVGLTGPVEPHLMDGVDPELLGRDMLPALNESIQVVDDRTTNWTAVPCPTRGLGHRRVSGSRTVDGAGPAVGRRGAHLPVGRTRSGGGLGAAAG